MRAKAAHVSSRFVDILYDAIKDHDFAEGLEGRIYIKLSKGTLKALGSGDLEFLKGYVIEYRRGYYKLRPKGFDAFLREKKYSRDDTVVLVIPLRDLVDAGILVKGSIEGDAYWFLGSKLLPPKEFINLYKLGEDTVRTLLKELGYLEILEKYGDRFKADIKRWEPNYIGQLNMGIVNIAVYVDKFVARSFVGAPVKEEGFSYYESGPTTEGLTRKNIEVRMYVHNPTPKDIEKIVEYVRYTEILGEDLIDNIVRFAMRELNLSVAPDDIDGSIIIKDYKIRELWVRLFKRREIGRKVEEIELSQNLDRSTYYRKYSAPTLKVRLERGITSAFLTSALSAVKVDAELPDGYQLLVKRGSSTVSLVYEKDFHGFVFNAPISVHYNAVRQLERVVKEVLKVVISKLEDAELKVGAHGAGVKVGDIMKFLDWGDWQDLDTIRLKLAALRLESLDKTDPPIAHMLVAYAVLEGNSQEKVTEALNRPIDVLLDLVAKKKLKVVPAHDGYAVLFKGKNIREVLSYKHYIPVTFDRVIDVLVGMATPRNELVEVRKRLAARSSS
jgi:hypothetical protein